MLDAAAKALEIIRDCLEHDRYIVTVHFADRMEDRGVMWPDVMAVIDDPADVRENGLDKIGRPKWIVAGEAADGLMIEIVCAIDDATTGISTVFITIF